MSSPTSSFAEGGLVLDVFFHPQFIFDWSCAVHVFEFLHYVFVTRRVHSGKDFGSTLEAVAFTDMMATRVSDLNIGWSPSAECSK